MPPRDTTTPTSPTPDHLPHRAARSDGALSGSLPDAGDGGGPTTGSGRNSLIDDLRNTDWGGVRKAFDIATGKSSGLGDVAWAVAPALLTTFEGEKSVSEQMRELGEKLKDSPFAKAFEKVATKGQLVDGKVKVTHEQKDGITIPMEDGSSLWIPGTSNPSWNDRPEYVEATFNETHNKKPGEPTEHKYEFKDVKGLMGSKPTKDQDWREKLAFKTTGQRIFGDIDDFSLTHKEHPTDSSKDTYTLHIAGSKFKGNLLLEEHSTMDRELKADEGRYLVLSIRNLKEKGTLAQNPGKANADES